MNNINIVQLLISYASGNEIKLKINDSNNEENYPFIWHLKTIIQN